MCLHDVTIKRYNYVTFHDVMIRNYVTILWDVLMENNDSVRCDYVMIRGDAIMWRLVTRRNMVRWLKLVQRNRSTAITTGERDTRWLRDFDKNFKFFSLFVFLGRIVIVTDWTRNVQKNTSVLQTFRGEKTSVHMSSLNIYPIGNYPIFLISLGTKNITQG